MRLEREKAGSVEPPALSIVNGGINTAGHRDRCPQYSPTVLVESNPVLTLASTLVLLRAFDYGESRIAPDPEVYGHLRSGQCRAMTTRANATAERLQVVFAYHGGLGIFRGSERAVGLQHRDRAVRLQESREQRASVLRRIAQ
jgi:hypothetical protein